MKKLSKLVAIILVIGLLAVPVSASQGSSETSLNYRGISITVDGEALSPIDASGKTVDPFIIDGTTYLPVRAISQALGCAVEWDDATSTITITSGGETVSHTLKAGAGVGEINWDPEVIAGNNEGFSGEYLDVPHARVLLLEDEIRVAIISLELVQPGNIVDELIAQVSEALDVPAANIWIHCTHTTTTLHIRGDEAAAPVFAAVKEACAGALETFQPAVMGIGSDTLDINVNRNIPIPEGLDPDQWKGKNAYGFTGTEYSPKDLTIIRFDSAETGEPIGFYMTYPMKPVGLDQSGKAGNERLITSDIPGYACTMVEDALGAPCLFFMPAAGDQVSKESATVPGYLEDGTWGQGDLGVEAGKAIIEKYGTLMGDAAIALAGGITADVSDADIEAAATSFDAIGVNRGTEAPTTVPVSAITIGDGIALVGFKPELDAITGTQLAEASPYDTTLLVAFLNGDSKYMPHSEAWDYNNGKGTQEVIDGAAYVRGTAETLVKEAVALLTEMQDDTAKSGAEDATLYYRDITIVLNGKVIVPTDVNGKVVEPFIIDGTTYLPLRAISEALGSTVIWNDANSSISVISAEAQNTASFKAGAGVGEIYWDPELVAGNNESFSGEYLDVPHARVLLLEDGERVAIVSLELVQPGNIVENLKALISETLDVPSDNIWIHCTHTTTTLHIRDDAAAAPVLAAVKEACVQALASFQPAVMGVGKTELDINLNRNMPIPEGLDPAQWTGKNAYGFADVEYSTKDFTIIRFDSALTGEPIGFYMTYPMKPAGLDQSGKAGNERLITSDIPGYACTMVEDALGVPCLYFTSAAGDQLAKESATVPGYLEDGTWGQGDLGVQKGVEIIEKYGKLMGDAALALVDSITADDDPVIGVAATSFAATGRNGRTGEESPTTVPVNAITIGDDVALIGFKPEIDGITGEQLQKASPYDTTLLVCFLNGDAKYMPHSEAWDYNNGKGTQEVIDGAAYVRGTAETFVEESVKLLKGMVPVAAENAMASIKAVGNMAPDGAKLEYIVLEYSEPVAASSVSLSDYEISTYGTISKPDCDLGSNPGKPVNIYVNNEPATSAAGGTSTGKYVIIEVNTNYQLKSMPKYYTAMIAGVKQVGTVRTASGNPILPGGEIQNYSVQETQGMRGPTTSYVADYSKVELTNVDKFEIHSYSEDTAEPFHATNCYSEISGTYYEDAYLMYSIFVPEGYSDNGKYALAMVIPDSQGDDNTDPRIALTTTQNSVNLASDKMQDYARSIGLDGIIVLAPQFVSSKDNADDPTGLNALGKVTYDEFAFHAGVSACWQLLDYLTTEAYPGIDTDRIYALGESGGGMTILAMAAQRDNYFAGLWIQGAQWGNNYQLDSLGMFPAPVDGKIITNENYRNWYYALSDDNVLLTTCEGDGNATPHAVEWINLYKDIAGATVPKSIVDPLGDSVASQNAALKALTDEESTTGLYWLLMEGGSHMQTFIYGPKLDNGYKWLLKQTSSSEDARGKQEALNAEWASAELTEEEQAIYMIPDRALAADGEGNPVYCAVPAEGAGTKGYNSTLAGRGNIQPLASGPIYDGSAEIATTTSGGNNGGGPNGGGPNGGGPSGGGPNGGGPNGGGPNGGGPNG